MEFQEAYSALTQLGGFTDDDAAQLQKHRAVFEEMAPAIIDGFYERLTSYPDAAAVFRDGEIADNKPRVTAWFLSLTSGDLNEEFWRHQVYVGYLHILRGVKNTYTLGMMSFVQTAVGDALAEMIEDTAEAERTIESFNRITSMVAGLIGEGFTAGTVEALISVAGLSEDLVKNMRNLTVRDEMQQYKATSFSYAE